MPPYDPTGPSQITTPSYVIHRSIEWRIGVLDMVAAIARFLQLRKIDTDDECLANSTVRHLHGRCVYDIAAGLCVMTAKDVSQAQRQRSCIEPALIAPPNIACCGR